LRQVIHIDLDAFFASVEALLSSELKGKPLIVAMGNPNGRGVVSTASYEARRFGVHSAMPLREAMRLCPGAVVVPVRHRVYSEYSQRVMDLLREYSPRVEQVSIDEAYVEIEEGRDAVRIASEIQQRIKTELGLDCTLGVASNKLVSKIACNTVKPRGLVQVPAGEEAQFLAPLPIERLPGAGKITRSKLGRWNVNTIGDLVRVPPEELRRQFGKHGAYMHAAAQGRDESPVMTEGKTKSISQENTFDRDTRDAAQIERDLAAMSDSVAGELEREGYAARTVVLKLRYGDFTTMTRQTTLRSPTAEAREIRDCVLRLFRSHWDRGRVVRLIGVGAHNLVEAGSIQQMELGL
jgi:nucleotidyltransferase/DNA polymerase involved in DNA repair